MSHKCEVLKPKLYVCIHLSNVIIKIICQLLCFGQLSCNSQLNCRQLTSHGDTHNPEAMTKFSCYLYRY